MDEIARTRAQKSQPRSQSRCLKDSSTPQSSDQNTSMTAAKNTAPMKSTVADEDLYPIIEARHADPFSVLGPHPVNVDGQPCVAIRAFLPGADKLELLLDQDGVVRTHDVPRVEDAFFEVLVPGSSRPSYRLRAYQGPEHSWTFEDPYRFPPVLGDLDIHLIGEGSHYRNFERMGSQQFTLEGVQGVLFAVWAPNARRVSLVGDFNDWDGRRNPMRLRGSSGIWEIFMPGLGEGDLYKFEIRTQEGHLRLKSDPYGFGFEYRPGTSSVVRDLDRYEWGDAEWMERRRTFDWQREPVSIYEVHLGSWMRVPEENDRFLSYREMAPRLAEYVEKMGFTHIELLPIQEHPFDGSWGYQPIGYFAPTSRFGLPDDFRYFVDHMHQRGIGVILDWVPAHFPRDDHGLRVFDGTHLYEHADPREGEHRDWGTLIFNYGRNEVRNFLLGSALFWPEKYHLDGIRVDAVASMLYRDYSRPAGEWIPNEFGGRENLEAVDFIKKFNEICHEKFPGFMTFAEESTAWGGVSHPTYLGGLGFSMKWNMGWMNDMLDFFSREPIYRKYHHQNLTFSLLYAFSENFVLPLSHDEVVHGKRSLLGKMPGDTWQKFANLRLLLGFQYAHPGKKLLFMGNEFGHGREWDHDSSLDWHLLDVPWHRGVQSFVRDLNHLYRSEISMHQVDFDWSGFQWRDFHDWESSVISFLRRGNDPEDELLFVFNFTPVPRGDYRIGVPRAGFYHEILNSDAESYEGSGMGNLGGVRAEETPSHDQPYSVNVTLPPLSMVVLKRER